MSITAEAAEQAVELKALLGAPGDLDRVQIIFGMGAKDPTVIGMRTRSLLNILHTLGLGVRIPQEDLDNGSASPGDPALAPGGFTVRSGAKEPAEAFAAVQYEGNWFWLDRHDLASKTTFSVATMMLSFLEANSNQAVPVLTIPTN